MKTVRFTSHYGIYNPGEVAGFQTDHADQLIGLGVAVSEGDAVATAEAAAEEVAATPKPDKADAAPEPLPRKARS